MEVSNIRNTSGNNKLVLKQSIMENKKKVLKDNQPKPRPKKRNQQQWVTVKC